MQLLSLTLKNYIGIYNGMGLWNLHIPFHKCKHKVVIIKGDNGSGKSTVFRALSPFSDASEDIIYNKDGYKNIQYLLDDQSVLSITYTFPAVCINDLWHHKNNKCSITRTYPNQQPIELNPSGNITTAKEIIHQIFQLDDNYLLLSALSSTNKGVGSLKPTDRKRYVNSVISALDEFISLNNIFSKKATILKSLLNNLSAKLSQIGNVTLLSDTLKKNQQELQQMEDQKTLLLVSVSKIKTQLDEINKLGNVIDIYAQAEKRLHKLKHQLDSYTFTYPNIEYSTDTMLSLNKMLSKEDAIIEMNDQQISTLLQEEASIRDELTKLSHQLDALFKQCNIDEIEKRLKEISTNIYQYKQLFIDAKIPKALNLDKEEYQNVLQIIDTANSHLDSLYDQYYESDIEQALHLDTDIESLRQRRSIIKDTIIKDDHYRQLAEGYENIPEGCQLKDTCLFVKSIVDANKNILSIEERNKLEQELQTIDHTYTLYDCLRDLKSVFFILQQFNTSIKQFIGSLYFQDQISMERFVIDRKKLEFNTYLLNSYFGYLDIIKQLEQDQQQLEQQRLEYYNNKDSSVLLKQKEIYDEQLQKLLDTKSKLMMDTSVHQQEKSSLETQLQQMSISRAEREKYDEILSEYTLTKQQVQSLYNLAQRAVELTKKHSQQSSTLSSITQHLTTLSKTIEKAKYQLSIYEQYKKDYDGYADTYKKVLSLRDHSSIHGIQSVYIEAFMNSILQLTNQLLQLLFKGRFYIKEFIVNEKEFSIPCIDTEGQERSDISDMSDSQLSMISMIISFVLLYKATGYYRIIKLDEVDASLDNTNRLQFSLLINQILDILQFNQCIIISHNHEIDVKNTDMIIFRVDNESEYSQLISSGANIIYSYK